MTPQQTITKQTPVSIAIVISLCVGCLLVYGFVTKSVASCADKMEAKIKDVEIKTESKIEEVRNKVHEIDKNVVKILTLLEKNKNE